MGGGSEFSFEDAAKIEGKLDAPVLLPGGGVFDGEVMVNISAGVLDDALEEDGNMSGVTTVYI